MSFKCVSEWTCLVFLVVVIVISHQRFVRPFQRGFFCDDETIRFPFVENQKVPAYLLLILTIPVPLIAVFALENRKRIWKFWKARFWTNFANVTSSFVFGTVITYFFTQTCKLTVGRLRPHFVDVCRPSFNYTDNAQDVIQHTMTLDNLKDCPHKKYITDYVCTTNLTSRISQAHFSFFSGHSSSIAFAMVFLCLVLSKSRLMVRHQIPTTCLQALLFTIALFTCNSRISDYWHHWEDVLVGLVVGIITAIITYNFLHREKLRTISRDSERSNEQTTEQGRKMRPLI